MRAWRQTFLVVAMLAAGCRDAVPLRPIEPVLNELRSDINSQYGLRDGVPRVNLGPCGRFAKAFREQWNARFTRKVDIAFVMSADKSICHHVLVRLPDGRFFDGGNGIMSEETLVGLWASSHVEVMTEFNFALLDRRSYSLTRSYPICPNYSDEVTTRIIKKHLDKLRRA